MKLTLKNTLRAILVVPALVAVLGLAAAPAYAAPGDLSLANGANSAQGKDQQGNAACLFGNEANCSGQGLFKTITNVLLFIIGAVSVIMLVIGGIRYTISGGDSNQVQGAKNTILYAIVGIIVAILAYAVVNFVISSFASN